MRKNKMQPILEYAHIPSTFHKSIILSTSLWVWLCWNVILALCRSAIYKQSSLSVLLEEMIFCTSASFRSLAPGCLLFPMLLRFLQVLSRFSILVFLVPGCSILWSTWVKLHKKCPNSPTSVGIPTTPANSLGSDKNDKISLFILVAFVSVLIDILTKHKS